MPLHIHRTMIRRGNILSAGYDTRERILDIEFSNHRIFRYQSVSKEIATRFLNSYSPESYFHDVIEEEYCAREISQTLHSKSLETSSSKAKAALDALFN